MMGDMYDDYESGERLIAPCDLCSDDDLEYLGVFGQWSVALREHGVLPEDLSDWRPAARSRFWWWPFGDWGVTTC